MANHPNVVFYSVLLTMDVNEHAALLISKFSWPIFYCQLAELFTYLSKYLVLTHSESLLNGAVILCFRFLLGRVNLESSISSNEFIN